MKRYQICRIAREVLEDYVRETDRAEHHFETGFCGFCGLGGSFVCRLFLNFGYKAKIVSGSYRHGCHYWTESDGKIWDITATQFGLKKVEKINCNEAKELGYEKIRYCSMNKIDDEFFGWCDEFRATKSRINYLTSCFMNRIGLTQMAMA